MRIGWLIMVAILLGSGPPLPGQISGAEAPWLNLHHLSSFLL